MTKVAIQGRQDGLQWVTAFKISYSTDEKDFQFLEKVFEWDKKRNDTRTCSVDKAECDC